MRKWSVRRWEVTVLVVLLLALVPTVAFPRARDAVRGGLIRRYGAVVPEGSGYWSFDGKPVRIVGVKGRPWAGGSRGEEMGAYVLVVLFPSSQIAEVERSSEGNDYAYSTSNRWTVRAGSQLRQVRVRSSYSPVLRTVRVGGERFALSRGNVFVVHVGEGGHPRVTQVNATVTDGWMNPRAIEDAVVTHMAYDPYVQEIVRDLHRSPQSRICPKQGPDGAGEPVPTASS